MIRFERDADGGLMATMDDPELVVLLRRADCAMVGSGGRWDIEVSAAGADAVFDYLMHVDRDAAAMLEALL